jgi:hypothetical protein
MKPFHLSINYKGKQIQGEALPLSGAEEQGIPLVHKLIIDGQDQGLIRCTNKSWDADQIKDKKLVEEIGNYIHAWYE